MPVPDDWPPFPLYLIVENDKRMFCTLHEAGAKMNSGFSRVEIGGLVLSSDRTVRDITAAERQRISDIADRIDRQK